MRIVVVAVGTRGDVEPHAALCAGLQRAGYDACLCAPDDFSCSVASKGIRVHPIPVSFRQLCESEGGGALLATGGHSLRFLRTFGRLATDVAAQIICTVRDACRQADAVCYSPLGLPAFYFARELGIPAFATSLQPLGRTNEYSCPVLSLPEGTPGPLNRLSYHLMEQMFWQIARPLLRRHMRDPLPFWGHYNALYRDPLPVLFGYSPLVVPRPRDWKPWMHATGYWRACNGAPPLEDGLEDFLAAGPAYTSLRGSYCNSYWQLQTLSTDEAILPSRAGGWYDGGRYQQMHYHNWTPDNPLVADTWTWGFSTISTCGRCRRRSANRPCSRRRRWWRGGRTTRNR